MCALCILPNISSFFREKNVRFFWKESKFERQSNQSLASGEREETDEGDLPVSSVGDHRKGEENAPISRPRPPRIMGPNMPKKKKKRGEESAIGLRRQNKKTTLLLLLLLLFPTITATSVSPAPEPFASRLSSFMGPIMGMASQLAGMPSAPVNPATMSLFSIVKRPFIVCPGCGSFAVCIMRCPGRHFPEMDR